MCHVAVIVALWGSVRLWPQRPQVLDRPVFNRADVIYYAPSEYLPPLDTGDRRRPLPRKGEPEHSPQPIISVPAEADNRTQTIVTPSDIKLNHDVPLPNIVAWSQNKAQPAVPLASTTAAANLRLPALPVTAVAPAPETMPANRQPAPMLSQTAVAPAPEVDTESSRTLRAPQAAVVQPPPAWTQPRSAVWEISTSDTRKWSRPRRNCPWPSNTPRPAGLQRRSAAAQVRRRSRLRLRFRAMRFESRRANHLTGHSPHRDDAMWNCRPEIDAELLPRLLQERPARPALLISAAELRPRERFRSGQE